MWPRLVPSGQLDAAYALDSTLAPSLAILALLMIPIGLPLSPWLGSLSASVQRAVPPGASTEAFTWTFAVITVGMASGSAIGGTIIQDANPGAAFLAAGALSLAGRGDRHAQAPRTARPAVSPA